MENRDSAAPTLGQVDQPRWIRFRKVPSGGATNRWAVETLEGNLLGHVSWFGRWRQYSFSSLEAWYEPRCLRDLANFCESQTREHRKSWKKTR
jgi:hypothetical protein